MADAVLTQRLIVGGAALALLFLIVLGIVAVFLAAAKVDSIIRETHERADAAAVSDPITLADLDEHAGAPHHPGLDRLRQAVRDEQNKGEQ